MITANATRLCLRIDLTHPFSCTLGPSWLVGSVGSVVDEEGEDEEGEEGEEDEGEVRSSSRIPLTVNGSVVGGGGVKGLPSLKVGVEVENGFL